MSKMAELDMQIRDLLDEGISPPRIAKTLDVPLTMVYDVLESYPDPDESFYDDSMDGDFDSARLLLVWVPMKTTATTEKNNGNSWNSWIR